ncbi:MAG: hypothetical protein ACP5IC_01385 [Minisyncoccia bacterium]
MIKDKVKQITKTLDNKGIVVMPTDTIYGIVGAAKYYDVVEKLYLHCGTYSLAFRLPN